MLRRLPFNIEESLVSVEGGLAPTSRGSPLLPSTHASAHALRRSPRTESRALATATCTDCQTCPVCHVCAHGGLREQTAIKIKTPPPPIHRKTAQEDAHAILAALIRLARAALAANIDNHGRGGGRRRRLCCTPPAPGSPALRRLTIRQRERRRSRRPRTWWLATERLAAAGEFGPNTHLKLKPRRGATLQAGQPGSYAAAVRNPRANTRLLILFLLLTSAAVLGSSLRHLLLGAFEQRHA